SMAYAFSRDMLGLRRSIEQLARQVADGFKYDAYLQLARGEYLRERGDAEGARAEIEPLISRTDMPMLQIPALPALAETLLALGHHQHLAETEHLFRKTRNPALVARVERLSEAGVRHGGSWQASAEPMTQRQPDVAVVSTEAVTTPPPSEIRSWVSAVLSGCR